MCNRFHRDSEGDPRPIPSYGKGYKIVSVNIQDEKEIISPLAYKNRRNNYKPGVGRWIEWDLK